MFVDEDQPLGIRQATPEEIRYDGGPLNLTEDFKEILDKGHVIDAFSSGGGVRVVRIFENQDGHDEIPILGYGEDSTVEAALRRARDTYRKREQTGQACIDFDSGEYPEIGIGLMTGGKTTTALDGIVHGGFGLRIFRSGEDIVVQTEYGRWSGPGIRTRGTNAQAAIDELVAAFGTSSL